MCLHGVHVEGEEAEEGQQVSGAQVRDSLSPVWVLGTKPVSSARATCASNNQAHFSSPGLFISKRLKSGTLFWLHNENGK